MAKKVQTHKRQNRGQETPRNSLELQVETSQIHCPEREFPYPFQVQDEWSKNNRYSNVASMKKLISGEFSKQSGTRNNTPSLVARLMGLDIMPLDTKSVVPSDERMSENLGNKFSKKGMHGRGSVSQGSSNLISSSQMEFNLFYEDIDDDGWALNFGKPRSHKHPHEEELQKFKKEFEAYQAAWFMESIPAKPKESLPSRSRTLSRDFESSMMKSRSRLDKSSSPARIVILKPGPDRICSCNHNENWISSSSNLQGRNGTEDLLEEVRERLECEPQGKTLKKGYVVQGSGIETPYIEKPSDPRDIAHHIAKEVRESVNRDAEAYLLRSESTRSYKSEIQFSKPSSPEFINRDTRRFLSERLRNVVKGEANYDIPEVTRWNSRSSIFDNHRVGIKQEEDTMKCSSDMSHWKILREEKEISTGSFRHEPNDNILLHKELSPRTLVRSLSAPVSGTSFGNLVLEDRDILTGAPIWRKLKAVKTMLANVKKKKKYRFNIKEKVSNFKHSLLVKGKLFGRRIQSIVKSHGNEYSPMVRDVTSGPTVLMKAGEKHENFTEVSPSPVSVCSSAQEELWRRTEYSSSVSTPDVYSRADNFEPLVFGDINSGLNELEDFMMKQEPFESELVQLEDPAESYIRDLLIASGLYFGSWDKSLPSGNTFAKHIDNSVFEKVEESHKKLIKEKEISIKDENENKKLEHKVLLDLLNEALSIVLGPHLTLSRFRRKLSTSSLLHPPCGKELLKLVWNIIHVSLCPPSNITPYSLDSLVAQDLGSIFWSGLINDEINILERELASVIADDMIEELTKDMLLAVGIVMEP